MKHSRTASTFPPTASTSGSAHLPARLPRLSPPPEISRPCIGDCSSRATRSYPSTSAPSSADVNSANQAVQALGNGARVEVIDSGLASLPMTLGVLEAAQAAEKSDDYRSLAQQVRESLPRYHAFFMLDTLDYLQKGGRIGKAQAFVGSMLSVKPILRILDGEVHPLERPRNRQRATRRLVEMTREMAPVRQLGVIYSTDPDPAQAVLEELSGLVPADPLSKPGSAPCWAPTWGRTPWA